MQVIAFCVRRQGLRVNFQQIWTFLVSSSTLPSGVRCHACATLPVELLTRDMASVESSDEEQVEEQDEATAGGADGGANANEGAGGSAECSGAHTLTRVEVWHTNTKITL